MATTLLIDESTSHLGLEIGYTDHDDVPTDAPSKYLTDRGFTYPALPPIPTLPKATIESESWSKPVINTAALPVIQAEQEILASVGLATQRKDLFFDEGTAFLGIGHANAVAERARLDALPSFEAEIARFQATINAENRRDTVLDVSLLRLNAAGNLDARERAHLDGGTMLSETAWRQLAAAVGGQNINKGLNGKKDMMRRMRARDYVPPVESDDE